ncbi:MAG: IS1380 family transposase [Rubrivivax sp.]|nr:IS1380 family transposase [Rubrivivax sp.]
MPNPNCTGQGELDLGVIEFGRLGRRVVEGRFDGGSMTSDGGVMLLSAADRKLGLIEAASRCIADPRNPLLITHAVRDMLRQRLYGLALGWEDLNDHKALRCDVAMQTAVGVDREVASAPTLCRLENWADRATAVRLHVVLLEQFIASFKAPPKEVVLDFDATDNPLHGQQEQRFFHGYYDNYCYLPLYVFCGQQLLCAVLRPSRIDGAQHAAAILKLLTRRLRQAWPEVRIIFRGDSGFCRQRIINWCERSDAHPILRVVHALHHGPLVSTHGVSSVTVPGSAHGHSNAGAFRYRPTRRLSCGSPPWPSVVGRWPGCPASSRCAAARRGHYARRSSRRGAGR